MVLIAVASAKATFIESFQGGRDAAYGYVYAATWFEAALGLLVVNLTLLFLKRWPYKARKSGFALLHLSIVVILLSAGVTRFLGYEGVMPIREGASANYYFTQKSHIQAGLGDEEDSYAVQLYKPGKNNIWHDVRLEGETYKLGVTEFWPNYTELYQEGAGGKPAIQYGVSSGREFKTQTLVIGDQTDISGVGAKFLTDSFSDELTTSRYGDLRLHVDGQSCTIPVSVPDGQIHKCGGFSFEIVEFQTDFKVGGSSNPNGPLINPMVRVDIETPDGTKGERLLFALHPDFSMGHGSGSEEEFSSLDLIYQVNSGIEFAMGRSSAQDKTVVLARATFAMESMNMGTEEEQSISAGQIFTLTESVFYKANNQDFSFVFAGFLKSAILGPAMSNNSSDPSAARIVIKDSQGNEATAICTKRARQRKVMLGGKTIGLGYGPVVRYLPYTIHLDQFKLDTYPGSDNPATYESYVTLIDEKAGISGKKAHIYMNNPLTHNGTKHFQSSYDPDRKGTVLSINHDPGKIPTYIGYGMLSLGFILIMARDLLWPRKKKGTKVASGKIAAALLALFMAWFTGGSALAQDHPSSSSDHPSSETSHSGGNNVAPPNVFSFKELDAETREDASRLIVQDFRGRMKPLDTLAREMVMKVAKKTKFQGHHPVDMFLSWSMNHTYWWDQPNIGLRYGGLKDFLGEDSATKHVSTASLFENGRYRLSSDVEAAHRTPDRDRSKVQRKLISFDERFNLLYMTFRGSSLKLFPVPGDPNNTWLDIEEISPHLNEAQGEEYNRAFGSFSEGIRTGNNEYFKEGVKRIRAIQLKYGKSVLPSSTKVEAELFYNRSHLFSWMMVPLLGASIVLMTLYVWTLFRNSGARLSFKNPFYAFGMALFNFAFAGMIVAYVMRWIASGRAPLSNGHESLLFISLAVALSGLIFEYIYRNSAPGGLASMLTVVVLGISMLSTFDPAIGPLVPVLVSYWLNIHVTIITASYGFLGLSALIGALVLFLLMAKGQGRDNIREAINSLDRINYWVVVAGLGLLSIGTLLGGVWANESWGRYWGWDAKETWSLVTILVYAVVLHFRFIPAMRSPWVNATSSMMAISSVVMTYFGVNYFLTGMHSYASGDAATVPEWVYYFAAGMVALSVVSGLINANRKWDIKAQK